MIVRSVAVALVSVLAIAGLVASSGARAGERPFALDVESPTVKVGERAVIVATLAARDGFRISESYRHRIVNVTAIDDGVEVGRKIVRGSVQDGRVVFRVDVVAKTAGAHTVVGIVRFSVNNGQQLDIKAAPFEATVTATE